MPNDKYFSGNPIRLDQSRCGFNRKPRWTGAWNTGYLVPIFATSSIMPGDSLKEKLNSAIRMSTPAFPTMDDLDITIEAFFVPHRLILSRKSMSPDLNDSNHSWLAFLGSQDSTLNMPLPGDVKLPKLAVTPAGATYKIGGLADCLGYPESQDPASTASYDVNCLKVLSYYMIWNEFFREPNTMNPVTYSIGSTGYATVYGTDAGIPLAGTHICSSLPLAPVCAYHGYFGSALPWPQRNLSGVEMPLGDVAPINAGSSLFATSTAVRFGSVSNLGSVGSVYDLGISLESPSGGRVVSTTGTESSTGISNIDYTNLYADLSSATAATVNQFRLAVQTQRWYEHLARCGNKYDDLINGMYGVQQYLPIDRPEYLGGFTAPILMSQVASTVGGSTGSLGQTGAYSLSNPSGFLFNKSFTEHGTLMVVMCVRCRDTFAQGIAREDTRFDRFDFYWQEFANIGEQPILNKELFVTGTSADDGVFGYQEAWAEYRMFPDIVTGLTRPQVSGGLGFVTYANLFQGAAPTLKSFLSAARQEVLVNRTLQVSSTSSGHQFFGQFEFDLDFVRPMPLYSIPGLVDHH